MQILDSLEACVLALNEFAGLFSLAALIVSVSVPWAIYHKQKHDEAEDLRIELEVRKSFGPAAMSHSEKQDAISREVLVQKLRKNK